MTRMSPHPCPYCGEHFELRRGPGTPQKHHVQNDWCRRQVELAIVALANAKRSKDRHKKRDAKPIVSIPRRIKNPWAFGVFKSTREYSWLIRMRREDAMQTVALALLRKLVNDSGLPRKRLTML